MLIAPNKIFFEFKNFFLVLLILFNDFKFVSENFKFPIFLIFFAPNFLRNFFVSSFCDKQTSNLLKSDLEKVFSLFQFLKDFLVILAFSNINLIVRN